MAYTKEQTRKRQRELKKKSFDTENVRVAMGTLMKDEKWNEEEHGTRIVKG